MTASSSPVWSVVEGPAHELGEEPTWDSENGRLLWVDVPAGEVWTAPLDSGGIGTPRRLAALPPPISAARPIGAGRVLVASGLDILAVTDDGASRSIGRLPSDPAQWQVNGFVVLPDASVLAGLLSRDRSEAGALVRLDPTTGGSVAVVESVQAANGLCVDHDRCCVWHVDTFARTLSRYPLLAEATLVGPGQVVTRFDGLPGKPDGVCTDPNGAVWVAMWDGSLVVQIDVDGRTGTQLTTPVARPTCPLVLPGPARRLLVTTACSPARESPEGQLLLTHI